MRSLFFFIKNLIVKTLVFVGIASIALVSYVIIADPLEIKPLIHISTNLVIDTTMENLTLKKRALALSQESGETEVMIDSILSQLSVTPQTQDCFMHTVGEKRTKELQKGDKLTREDFLHAWICRE